MQWLALVGFSLVLATPSCSQDLLQLPYELAEAAGLTSSFGLEKRGLKCFSCQALLGALKSLPAHQAATIAQAWVGSRATETPPINFAQDMFNALSLMDPYGTDGQYMCHFLMGRSCELPATPKFEYNFPPPPPKVQAQKHCGRTFKALHISDIHLQLNYTVGSSAACMGPMCCTPHAVQDPMLAFEPAAAYGSFKCDCPESLMTSALDSIAMSPHNFEFALFTGDMVDHDPIFMSKSLCLAEEQATMRALKAYLGDMSVYPVLGNHDTFPFSQDAAAWTGFAHKFDFNSDLMAHMMKDSGWISEPQAQDIHRHHGAYSVEARPGLQVISINTNFWYSWNFYNYAKTEELDPSGMLRFVVDELAKCEKQGKRAWITGHVPPGGLTHETLPGPSEHFSAILERFSSTIAATFFGHTHRDEFTVLYANNATERTEEHAVLTAYMAPSITPYTDLNPGWRYYEIDEQTFEVMDVVTMFANISEFSTVFTTDAPLEWKFGYSARDYYGTHPSVDWPKDQPLNAKFWHRVAAAMLQDPEMANLYNSMATRLSPQTGKCDDKCRFKQYCYTTSMTTPQAMRCRQEFDLRQRRLPMSDRWMPLGSAGKWGQQVLQHV